MNEEKNPYQIKKGPIEIDKAKIQKYKNFKGVLDHSKDIHQPANLIKRLGKNYRLISFIILVFVIILLLFLADKEEEKNEFKNKPTIEQQDN